MIARSLGGVNINMKKNIIRLGLLCVAINNSFAVAANDNNRFGGQIYGRLNVSYQLEHNEVDGNVWKLANNASRLGFKGNSNFSDDTAMVYQLEFGVEADDGDKNGKTLSQRDIFLGVDSQWGRVIAGRITIPFKEAKGNFDHFNDLQGELGKIIDGEERLDNVVQYDTKKIFGPLTATLAIVPGEDATNSKQNGPVDGVSSSLVYKKENLYFSAAINSNIEQQDQLRLVSTWQLQQLRLGVLFQHSKTSEKSVLLKDGSTKANAYGVSASYQFNSNKINSQYIISDSSMELANARQFSISLEHKLSQSTTAYGYIADRHSDDASNNNRYFVVGFKHNF